MELPSNHGPSGPPDAPSTATEPPGTGLLADLFARHRPELLRMLLGVLRDRDRAEDALQATFARAIERAAEVDARTARGWLFRVAYNEAITARRTRARHRRHEPGLAWLREARRGEPADPLIRDEAIAAVRRALEELPPETAAVIRARIVEEKTFATIAEEQRIPLGTALTRMRRGLERLAHRLRDEDDR